MKNYYEILEVDPKASNEIIEKAYKVLAKKYHPDTQSIDKKEWAEAKFKEINEAYEILSNKESRKNYDIEFESDKDKAIKAICAKNEHLQHIVDELQSELNILRNQTQNNGIYNIIDTYRNNISHFKQPIENKNIYGANNFARNYTHPFKKRKLSPKQIFENFIAFLITFFCIIIIGFLLWKIPLTNKFLVNLYNNNTPLKAIVNYILHIFGI